MSMRQLHENDPLATVVTDSDGKRFGIMIAKHDQWCWVIWDEADTPVTENTNDLWICEQRRESSGKFGSFLRGICRPSLAGLSA